jgi:uncharacterized membrane protein YkoI
MRKHLAFLAAAAIVASGLATPVVAQRGRGPAQDAQASARQQMQAGREMTPREIEQRIVPMMRGSEYLGFEYDSGAGAYRFKFLKDGQVTWVDADARTGRVLRISR